MHLVGIYILEYYYDARTHYIKFTAGCECLGDTIHLEF
jgi:hypothetical protein